MGKDIYTYLEELCSGCVNRELDDHRIHILRWLTPCSSEMQNHQFQVVVVVVTLLSF